MSQSKKLQDRILELQTRETKLKSALEDEIGDQEALKVDLRNTQAQLKKLRERVSEK